MRRQKKTAADAFELHPWRHTVFFSAVVGIAIGLGTTLGSHWSTSRFLVNVLIGGVLWFVFYRTWLGPRSVRKRNERNARNSP